jgi:hypothetical protein
MKRKVSENETLFSTYPIEYINLKTYAIARKIIHTVLHIDYEVVSQSTATAYLRIRVTLIRVSRGLCSLVYLLRHRAKLSRWLRP